MCTTWAWKLVTGLFVLERNPLVTEQHLFHENIRVFKKKNINIILMLQALNCLTWTIIFSDILEKKNVTASGGHAH